MEPCYKTKSKNASCIFENFDFFFKIIKKTFEKILLDFKKSINSLEEKDINYLLDCYFFPIFK